MDATALLLFFCLQNAQAQLQTCSTTGPCSPSFAQYDVCEPERTRCRERFRQETTACIDAAATAQR